jgi:NADH-quinone oxidoreductase subunit J
VGIQIVLVQAFYTLLFVLALFSALMVVLSSHAVYSALYLVLTMISLAGLFIMMNAQLAAAFQVIVYAGAIMVLFMFVIMLLSVGRQEVWPLRNRLVRGFGLIFSLAFIGQIIAALASFKLGPAFGLDKASGVNIQQVAQLLLTDYIYPFEMTSVLLLVAVIGAVVLARRFVIQGRVQPEDRV